MPRPLRAPLSRLRLRELSLIAALLGWVWAAEAVSLRRIEDPRPRSWVVDQTGTLSRSTIAELDRLAARVKGNGGELVVVVVGSTDGADSRRFATDLGNRWDLDPRGVLVFVATEDRSAEIILGHSVDSTSQVRASQRIMDRELLPAFRAERYGEGLLATAREVERTILAPPREQAAQAAPPPSPPPPTRVAQEQPAPATPLLEDPGAPAAEPRANTVPKKPAPRRSKPAKQDDSTWPAFGCLGSIIFGVLAGRRLLKGSFRLLSRRPRCKACGVDRILLDEAEDDAHLSAGERAEEDVGSVDYKVWACPSCGDVLKKRNQRFFKSHRKCPSCGYVTLSRVETVLFEPTTTERGLVEVEERCENCGRHVSSRHTTPMRIESQPATTSFGLHSGGSRASSSFHSSSRPSSSSRGGFSSGKGASGKW
ncbi:MAG: TPM domain-containing protein [Acidobacteria bacterium]|nr:TPM domain-containing protein [Acidobacteriota bacterium]